jgi:hypothetical protein
LRAFRRDVRERVYRCLIDQPRVPYTAQGVDMIAEEIAAAIAHNIKNDRSRLVPYGKG